MKVGRLLTGVLLAASLLCSACATVLPSARGTLSERCMQPSADPLEVTMDLHVFENREAQVGARYGRGASCGCN